MSLDELSSTFVNFMASLEATRLTTKLAIKIFDDFPNNLKEIFDNGNNSRGSFDILEEIFPELFISSDEIKEDKDIIIDLPYYYTQTGISPDSHRVIVRNLLDILDVKNLVNEESIMLLNRINYERLFLSQQLIMYFAHLDAVLMDFFRQICLISPSILKRNKKISFKDVIDNQENIINVLLDKFALEFNYKTLEEKINLFKEDIKIDFEIEDSGISFLNKAEQIRHIFVHNAGKMDMKFLEKIDIKSYKEGDIYPLEEKHNEMLYFVMSDLITVILDGIIRKFRNTLIET